MDATDVAQSIAFTGTETVHPMQLESALVLLERAPVVASLVIDQADVVENGRFELLIFELPRQGKTLLEVLEGFGIGAHLPVDQPQVIERLSDLEPIAHLPFHRKGAPEMDESLLEITEAFVAVADEPQGDSFAPPVAATA